MPEPKQKTKWWLAAILAPIVSIGLGALITFGASRNPGDLLGLQLIAPAFGGFVVGGVLGVVFALVSYLKNENGRATRSTPSLSVHTC
jgi:hypothetical protein